MRGTGAVIQAQRYLMLNLKEFLGEIIWNIIFISKLKSHIKTVWPFYKAITWCQMIKPSTKWNLCRLSSKHLFVLHISNRPQDLIGVLSKLIWICFQFDFFSQLCSFYVSSLMTGIITKHSIRRLTPSTKQRVSMPEFEPWLKTVLNATIVPLHNSHIVQIE